MFMSILIFNDNQVQIIEALSGMKSDCKKADGKFLSRVKIVPSKKQSS